MARFRGAYGSSPLHLLAVIASFAVAGYAFFRIFDTPTALGFIVWFGGAIVAHDLIAFPLYSLLNLIATGSLGGIGGRDSELRVPALNHLRIPALLSGLALLLFFPLVLGLSADNYVEDTGVEIDVFLGRWLGLVGALFLGSALIYAVRLGRAERLAEAAAEEASAEDGDA
jgi:hypothetical protein